MRVVLSVSRNSRENLDFAVRTLSQDDAAQVTDESEGTSYRKLLCLSFDLALLRAHAKEGFYRFVYHDGVFEALDNRKKVALLDLVGTVCTPSGSPSSACSRTPPTPASTTPPSTRSPPRSAASAGNSRSSLGASSQDPSQGPLRAEQPHALSRRDSRDYDEARGGSRRSRAVVTAGSVGEMLVWYAPLPRLRAIQFPMHRTHLDLTVLDTNARSLYPDWDSYRDIGWGAGMLAAAHVLGGRITDVLISSTGYGVVIPPHASHPLLDGLYSTAAVRARHALPFVAVSRSWSASPPGPRDWRRSTSAWGSILRRTDLPTAARCNKCMRTMLGLAALGRLGEAREFPRQDLDAAEVSALPLDDAHARRLPDAPAGSPSSLPGAYGSRRRPAAQIHAGARGTPSARVSAARWGAQCVGG